MTTAYTEFQNDIVLQAPGCPDTTILRAIARTATEFFRRSTAWRVDFLGATSGGAPVAITSGVPVNCRVLSVIELRYNDELLGLKTPTQFTRMYPDEPSGSPLIYTVFESDDVRVMPYPATSGLVNVFDGRAIITPTKDATELPDDMFDKHFEAIMTGTLGKLFIMGHQSWSDRQMGLAYSADFDNKIRIAKREKRGESGAARIAVGAPYGGLVSGASSRRQY